MRSICLAIVVSLTSWQAALAAKQAVPAQPKAVQVWTVTTTKEMKGLTFFDTASKGLHDPIIGALISAAATYLGAPKGSVTAVTFIVDALKSKQDKEDYDFAYAIPKGTQICAIRASQVSSMPKNGKDVPLYNISFDPSGLLVHVKTPQQKDGAKTYVELSINIIAVTKSYARHHPKCAQTPKVIDVLACKGTPAKETGNPCPPHADVWLNSTHARDK